MKIFRLMFKVCIFHEITGLYCPGCGGTRAFFSLLHGHPVLSFMYNPIVLYFVFVIIFYALWGILYFLSLKGIIKLSPDRSISMHKKNKSRLPKDIKNPDKKIIPIPEFKSCFVFIFIGIILGNMFIKDVALIFFHVDLMP